MSVALTSRRFDEHTIRIPLKMYQVTEQDGRAWPVAFDWENPDGEHLKIKIDRIVNVTQEAELRSGSVGDRYEVEIGGMLEFLYYTKLAPRKWFKIVTVSEQEYKDYYKLPGEANALPQ